MNVPNRSRTERATVFVLRLVAFLFSILVPQASAANDLDRQCFSFRDESAAAFDPDTAAAVCERLARSGNLEAVQALVEIHSKGLTGDGTDFDKAAEWARFGAERGNVVLQFQFANMLFDGIGVDIDMR